MVGNELHGDGRGEAQRRAERLQAGVWLLAGVEMSRGECVRGVRCEEKGWEGGKDNVCEGFGLWSLHKEKPGWELFRVRAAPGRSSPATPITSGPLTAHPALRERSGAVRGCAGPLPAAEHGAGATARRHSELHRDAHRAQRIAPRRSASRSPPSSRPGGWGRSEPCSCWFRARGWVSSDANTQIRRFLRFSPLVEVEAATRGCGSAALTGAAPRSASSLEGFLLDIALCRVHS